MVISKLQFETRYLATAGEIYGEEKKKRKLQEKSHYVCAFNVDKNAPCIRLSCYIWSRLRMSDLRFHLKSKLKLYASLQDKHERRLNQDKIDNLSKMNYHSNGRYETRKNNNQQLFVWKMDEDDRKKQTFSFFLSSISKWNEAKPYNIFAVTHNTHRDRQMSWLLKMVAKKKHIQYKWTQCTSTEQRQNSTPYNWRIVDAVGKHKHIA